MKKNMKHIMLSMLMLNVSMQILSVPALHLSQLQTALNGNHKHHFLENLKNGALKDAKLTIVEESRFRNKTYYIEIPSLQNNRVEYIQFRQKLVDAIEQGWGNGEITVGTGLNKEHHKSIKLDQLLVAVDNSMPA